MNDDPRGPTPADAVPLAPAPEWRLVPGGDGVVDLVAADGTHHRDVEIRRAFPVSHPEGPIAIFSGEGIEVAWLDALAGAPAAMREVVETVLREREGVPVITAIERIGDSRPAEWRVMTAGGPLRFRVAHTDDVFRRPDGSLCISDANGRRYEIPDPRRLDAQSRRLLEQLG
jgi:hypothetical protein